SRASAACDECGLSARKCRYAAGVSSARARSQFRVAQPKASAAASTRIDQRMMVAPPLREDSDSSRHPKAPPRPSAAWPPGSPPLPWGRGGPPGGGIAAGDRGGNGVIEAVVFDMDGLLIDSEPLWQQAEIEIFARVGIHLDAQLCLRTRGRKIDEVVDYW